jgi:sulfotransferase family protein
VSRPQFFVVGHPKCGTTALANFLRQHPEIFVSLPKEPCYFVPTWCRAEPPSMFVRRTEEEYLALFDGADDDQVPGEASVVYLNSPEAADLIHAFNPHARIVMVFREPFSFLRSLHLQLLNNPPADGESVADLGEAIALEPERREGRRIPRGCVVPELLMYTSEWLRYADHYDRFAERFPTQQRLTLVYDDFRRDNQGMLAEVFRFLGVDPEFRAALREVNVGGRRPRAKWMQRGFRTATHGGGMVGRARAAVPRPVRRRMIRAYRRNAFRAAAPVPDDLAATIRRIAAPHVAALGSRIGRDLTAEWRLA